MINNRETMGYETVRCQVCCHSLLRLAASFLILPWGHFRSPQHVSGIRNPCQIVFASCPRLLSHCETIITSAARRWNASYQIYKKCSDCRLPARANKGDPNTARGFPKSANGIEKRIELPRVRYRKVKTHLHGRFLWRFFSFWRMRLSHKSIDLYSFAQMV